MIMIFESDAGKVSGTFEKSRRDSQTGTAHRSAGPSDRAENDLRKGGQESSMSEKKDKQEQGVVKRKRRVGNPAMTGEAITATPEEQASLIMQSLAIANLPRINLKDPEQVRDRINEYFAMVARNGNRPTVTGLGLALNNMDRFRLYEIRTGNYGNTRGETANLPLAVTNLIKSAYRVMEELWEQYMQQGKINPVSGIFLGKNHYGYQDKQDIVVTPNAPETEYSVKDITERYLLPEDKDSDEAP